jgi:hypothetical protein
VPQRQRTKVICVRLHERGYPLNSATLKCCTCRALASSKNAICVVDGPFSEFPLHCGSANRTSYESRTVQSPGGDCRACHHTQHGHSLKAEAAFRTHRCSPLPKPAPKQYTLGSQLCSLDHPPIIYNSGNVSTCSRWKPHSYTDSRALLITCYPRAWLWSALELHTYHTTFTRSPTVLIATDAKTSLPDRLKLSFRVNLLSSLLTAPSRPFVTSFSLPRATFVELSSSFP